MRSSYYIVKSLEEVKKVIQSCKETGYCCFDYETNAQPLYMHTFTPTLLSITFQVGSSVQIPLDHFERDKYTDGFDWKKALQMVGKELFQNLKVTKIAWNAKFDDQINKKFGIQCKGTLLDGMLAKYILNEEKPNGLKEMVVRYLPGFAGYQKENNLDKMDWDKKPLDLLSKYAGMDTDCTLRLTLFFEKKLIDLGMYNILRNLYMPASRLLTEVEANGLYLDRGFNQQLLAEYEPKIQAARDTIYSLPRVQKFNGIYIQGKIQAYLDQLQRELDELDPDNPKDKRKISSRETKIANIRAGIFITQKEQDLIKPINLNSNKDLPALMYSKEGLNLPIIAYTQQNYKDTDKPSTAEDTLVELRLRIKKPDSPKAVFLDKLLELRGLEKMYKTYILGWSEKVQDDDCLHGRFLLHGTTSGRLSSAEPNMQQIPKTSVDPNIKKQLIAKPGQLYLVMDFSQAELRIMAHLSKDETYLKAFRENKDPHLAIAAQKYGVPYDEAEKIYGDENHPDYKLWKTRRKQAKQIAFGLIYGIQSKLLSVKLSDPKAGLIVTPEEAQQMMDDYFAEHPRIKKFMGSQERLLYKQGYIKSLFGTKRRLPGIYSENNADVAYAIRLAVNFPCQGAASHMTLFGAILNYWDMKRGYFPPMDEVCTVHDAVYYNTNPKYINLYTIWKLWDTFRNPKTKEYFNFQINDVDMSMDFEIGRTMGEELPFIPGYDYSKMLQPDFSVEAYMEEYHKFKDIPIKDYPKHFPELFEQGKQWRQLK
jgi:DNA polymerase-1